MNLEQLSVTQQHGRSAREKMTKYDTVAGSRSEEARIVCGMLGSDMRARAMNPNLDERPAYSVSADRMRISRNREPGLKP